MWSSLLTLQGALAGSGPRMSAPDSGSVMGMTALTPIEAATIYEAVRKRLPQLAGKFADDYRHNASVAWREPFRSLISEVTEA